MLNLLQLNHYKTDNINQYCLSIFNISVFVVSSLKNRYWFRVFGFGLRIKHKSIPLRFSERNGYSKYKTVGNYRISLLK